MLAGVVAFSRDTVHEPSRGAIWANTIGIIRTAPWIGVGGTTSDYVSAAKKLTTSALNVEVTHAHDLWLELWAAYGLLGLIAGLWLSIALVRLGWSFAGPKGLAIVLISLLLQVADYTLFFAAVWIPLVVAVATFARTPMVTSSG